MSGPPSAWRCRVAAALAVAANLLLGCAGTSESDWGRVIDAKDGVEIARGIRFPLLAPSTLGEEIAADQAVVVHSGDRAHRFLARLECDTRRLVVVGFTASVGRAFVVSLEDGEVRSEDHTGGRLPFDPRFMLSDIQLAFWPEIPPIEGLVLKVEHGPGEAWSRVLRRGGEPVITISYETPRPWAGRVVFEHVERGYRLEVTTGSIMSMADNGTPLGAGDG